MFGWRPLEVTVATHDMRPYSTLRMFDRSFALLPVSPEEAPVSVPLWWELVSRLTGASPAIELDSEQEFLCVCARTVEDAQRIACAVYHIDPRVQVMALVDDDGLTAEDVGPFENKPKEGGALGKRMILYPEDGLTFGNWKVSR